MFINISRVEVKGMAKYFIISKKGMATAVIILLAVVAGILFVALGEPAVAASASQKKLPVYSVKRDDKKIAISFDAAWGADSTDSIIDTLEKYNVKTTFFVVGKWAEQYPDKVKKLSDAGHEVENHSYGHPHMTNLSKDEMKNEIESCNSKVEEITGKRPSLLRAPYGDYNNSVIESVEECGMTTVQWSVDSIDWKGISADEIVNRVISKVTDGSIVLFHNAAEHTPEALPSILEKLQADGYEIVPVSQLLYTENYSIDPNGAQIKN